MPRIDDLRIRHGTAAQWASVNPILNLGEPAFETDTLKAKTGDGVTQYNSLPYNFGGATTEVVNSLSVNDVTKGIAASQGPVITNQIATVSSAAAAAQASASGASATALLADAKATTATTAATTATSTATAAAAAAAAAAQLSGATFTGPVLVPTPTLSTHATTKGYVDAAVAGVAGGIPITTTFSQAIPFDSYRTMGETMVSSALTFTVNATGAVDAGETILSLVADGTHVPSFAAFNLAGSQGYDNTPNRVNNITFFRDFGRYYYGVVLGPVLSIPALVSATVSDSDATSIALVWSVAMNSTISAASAFTVSSGHALTAHTYVDSTHTTLTTSTPFVQSEAKTLAYTQPGSNKMVDLAAGFLVANFSGASITNSVTNPTLSTASVANATPLHIDLTWSEPISSTIPAASAFAVSSGHTLTAHTYVDSTHTYLTTSAAFVNGEGAKTLSYTVPGTNPIKDLAVVPNLGLAFSGAAITNNVASGATTLAADTFNRADASSSQAMSDGVHIWTDPSSGIRPGIASNRAIFETRQYVDIAQTSYTVGIDCIINNNNEFCGPLGRYTDDSNCIEVEAHDNVFDLIKKDSTGGNAALATGAGAYTLGVSTRIELVVTPTTVTVKQDGTVIIGPITNSFNASATKVGVCCFGSATSRFDNFLATT